MKEDNPLDVLIALLARLPGLGPRSGRRIVLHLIKNKEITLKPLVKALQDLVDTVQTCSSCGNIGLQKHCSICLDPQRDTSLICVVENVADLWALEKAMVFKGLYHVLGGTLSAFESIGPEDLNIPLLVKRVRQENVREVILATSMTVDGQTTAHYIAKCLQEEGLTVSTLARGVPFGGELDYLDEGTLGTALQERSLFNAGQP